MAFTLAQIKLEKQPAKKKKRLNSEKGWMWWCWVIVDGSQTQSIWTAACSGFNYQKYHKICFKIECISQTSQKNMHNFDPVPSILKCL